LHLLTLFAAKMFQVCIHFSNHGNHMLNSFFGLFLIDIYYCTTGSTQTIVNRLYI